MSKPFEPSETELPDVVRGSWHRFLDTYEPLRPELFRYCRHLTRSPWDAEDLAQDAMARAFVTLGKMGHPPANPRAWLFRVASNLWIDQVRRRRREQPLDDELADSADASDPAAAREAAGTLIGRLSPQQRAAVVLKDVFELSLDEIAEALSTTPGAVKAALHRARGKLVEPEPAEAQAPAPAVIDAFCAAFNAGDLDRLTALLLDTTAVEVVGATTQYGPEAARRTVLFGMLFGSRRMATVEWKRGSCRGSCPTPPGSRRARTAASGCCSTGTRTSTAMPFARSRGSSPTATAWRTCRTTSSPPTSSPRSAASSACRSA